MHNAPRWRLRITRPSRVRSAAGNCAGVFTGGASEIMGALVLHARTAASLAEARSTMTQRRRCGRCGGGRNCRDYRTSSPGAASHPRRRGARRIQVAGAGPRFLGRFDSARRAWRWNSPCRRISGKRTVPQHHVATRALFRRLRRRNRSSSTSENVALTSSDWKARSHSRGPTPQLSKSIQRTP